ncbi:DNA-directed RNA polymerase subunit N [Candidatus Aciduliprofundum boonei]|uniref:DNA-directed RNA polymerase subunit N n=1 Tax=Candidatus Aciduliprofundum boonei TaxID=379547 RepID=UPI000180395F|nr:DNA-directed RNA polymerase subunit N [Candidatus Aciduliprofundum boonei]EDY35861.1 RNA polymerases N / 8 kDa subunit superfamily [Aciduliprofundum boonei T469]EDY36496.1 RNA polymerases N / 8 kDa subunit superfamily [Aciduliprofundum boonei T469]HII55542.1 DNA-directed RNA polymerase subunit N [Candidatus Aciduliprofundum boonei]
MIIPVRCFSCGRVIASDYIAFVNKVNLIRETENREPTPEEIQRIFDEIGVKRYCCRRMILSHVNLIDDTMAFD